LIVSLSGDELYLKLAEFSGRMPRQLSIAITDGIRAAVPQADEKQSVSRSPYIGKYPDEAASQELIATLKQARGAGVVIAAELGDPESHRYAEYLRAMFRQAGWDVVSSEISTPYRVHGVTVELRSTNEMPDSCRFASTALTAAGIGFKVDIAGLADHAPGGWLIHVGKSI